MKCFTPKELPYYSDSIRWLSCLYGQRNIAFLDSKQFTDSGDFDILSANPEYLICGEKDGTTIIKTQNSSTSSSEDPLNILKRYIPTNQDVSHPLFNGGAIGYFGYDWGLRMAGITSTNSGIQLPEFSVGIYNWAVVNNHQKSQTHLVGHASENFSQQDFDDVYVMLQSSPQDIDDVDCVIGELYSNMDKNHYIDCFSRIKQYIKEGDCYQVNLAQQFSVEVQCNPYSLYKKLRDINPAPFSAYLDYGDFQILSVSPERFLQLHHNKVQTKPIKGTRPRRQDSVADENERKALLSSKKDRAENLMIVDLLRNDLGKVCHPGSIKVHKLFDIESFTNVHHMVSTVEGNLKEDFNALDLLKACFPGGSITGAPKHRAMQIIDELEPSSRGVYCGAIGYIDISGDMDLNIAIRTAVYKDQTFMFYGGGGIVADSDGLAEYQEIFDKVLPFFELFSKPIDTTK